MRKLRLDLEELDVQSFDTGETPRARGTIRAREFTLQQCNDTGQTACDANTCAHSCDTACDSYYCPPVGGLTADACELASIVCTYKADTVC